MKNQREKEQEWGPKKSGLERWTVSKIQIKSKVTDLSLSIMYNRTRKCFVDFQAALITNQIVASRRWEVAKIINCCSMQLTVKRYLNASFVKRHLLQTSCETNTRTWHTSSDFPVPPVERSLVRKRGFWYTVELTVGRNLMYARTVAFPVLRRTTCDCTNSSSTQAWKAMKKDSPAHSAQPPFSPRATWADTLYLTLTLNNACVKRVGRVSRTRLLWSNIPSATVAQNFPVVSVIKDLLHLSTWTDTW